MLCTLWHPNVLRATTACAFSTSQLPKVLRTWCVFSFLTCKCSSRPNLVCFVHFDLETCFAPQRRAIFHLSSGQLAPHPPLQRAYFSTLWSHKSLEKHSVSRLSYLFAHLDLLSSETLSFLIFFLLLFSSLTLPISAFHLPILSEVWLLNFLRLYIYIWNIYEYPLIIHRWSTKTDLKSSGCCRKKKNGLRKNTRAPNGIELCSFVVSASGQCGSFDSRRLCRANAVWRFQQISVQTASSQSQTTWIVTELALCILTTTTFFFIISIVSIPVQVGTSSILISLLWWGLWSLHLCVIANPSIVGTMPWVLFKPLPFAKEAGIKTTRIYKNLSESLKLCKNL